MHRRRPLIGASMLAPAPPPLPPGPAPRSVVAQLTDLKGLLDSGALTPEEFAAAKRLVLGT
jgi:hypothetical protein